jgi:polysaccharide export outer membrane protein
MTTSRGARAPKPPASLPRASLGVLLLSLSLSACVTPGKFIWVEEYEQKHEDTAYIINPGDLLFVRVWNQEALTGRARVREDGKISVPFLNDVQAAGTTPPLLAQQIQTRLKEFINNPLVTVSLEEIKPLGVTVAGEVMRPGQQLQLPSGAGVLQAIANAGGLTEYAKKDLIFVIRPEAGGAPVRIRFTYQALIRNEGRASTFRLRTGDIVVVE